ncbi:uncharacterized protein G2W53_037024 [Senna tora]|uniref:Uncharacterized protein n=1 Tax=Senna tora TaxID=362788 RepID=A0A834SV14_9FABA|nr:uncharacterized protein G2W53_037024 [Senna tora]
MHVLPVERVIFSIEGSVGIPGQSITSGVLEKTCGNLKSFSLGRRIEATRRLLNGGVTPLLFQVSESYSNDVMIVRSMKGSRCPLPPLFFYEVLRPLGFCAFVLHLRFFAFKVYSAPPSLAAIMDPPRFSFVLVLGIASPAIRSLPKGMIGPTSTAVQTLRGEGEIPQIPAPPQPSDAATTLSSSLPPPPYTTPSANVEVVSSLESIDVAASPRSCCCLDNNIVEGVD